MALQLLGMVLLAVFGLVVPVRAMADANPEFLLDYRGVVLGLDDLRIYAHRYRPLRRLQVAEIQNSTREGSVSKVK